MRQCTSRQEGQAVRLLTIEMEHLMEMGDKAVVPVLTYLFRQIYKRLDGSPTLLILDEAWVLLQHDMFKERIRQWLKEFRKKNAAVVLATQSLSDVINSPIRDVLLESCPTKILLPNPEATNDNSRGFYAQLGLNSREIQILASATPKRQYYFYSPIGRRLVSMGLGPVALPFVGVGDAESKRKAEQMMQRNPHGWQEQWLRGRGLERWADYYATQCVPRRVGSRELVPDQVRAVKDSLRATPLQNVQQIAAGFKPAIRTRIAEILETLTALGQTRRLENRYQL